MWTRYFDLRRHLIKRTLKHCMSIQSSTGRLVECLHFLILEIGICAHLLKQAMPIETGAPVVIGERFEVSFWVAVSIAWYIHSKTFNGTMHSNNIFQVAVKTVPEGR